MAATEASVGSICTNGMIPCCRRELANGMSNGCAHPL
jgi:hypothetical protein